MNDRVIELKSARTGAGRIGGRTVLNPKTSITYQNSEEIEAMIHDSLKRNKTEIILDCKSVSFMDSVALELINQVHEDLKNRGGILKLVGLNAICRDILLATRLMNEFNVYTDVHEAIKSV
ncbi:STAS domain-containing protein [Thermodesulfobacteriota bacterium]